MIVKINKEITATFNDINDLIDKNRVDEFIVMIDVLLRRINDLCVFGTVDPRLIFPDGVPCMVNPLLNVRVSASKIVVFIVENRSIVSIVLPLEVITELALITNVPRLFASGFNVTFVRNVTDIDDKILHKSVHEGIPWWQVAMKYERAFTDAYNWLNVMPPTYEPRATGHITQMIELMQRLIENGSAYAPGNGDVYLEVRKLKEYLTLSNQKLDDLQSSEDSDSTYKKDPRDFALWKAAKKRRSIMANTMGSR